LQETKQDLIKKAKQQKIEKSIFKSSNEKNYSLTEVGFEFLKSTSSNVFTLKADDIKPKDIILLNKIFDSPFFINNNKKEVYHFDKLINAQSYFYKKDLRGLLENSI
jgi:hypothetical protein